ncbi:DUF6228 family protein [Streptomyces cahuitamycinicus]|uniref:DUF6228 family protein n=1 Tax=Streptomyces cahuitamycinicus TaxID=2070367 RepID=UPI0031843BE8
MPAGPRAADGCRARSSVRVIDYDDSGRPVVQVGDPGAARLLLSEPTRPFEDEPTLDFLLRACGPWGVVETPVQTWDGDGLDTFLTSLAEDFRGWEGVRTWHSLCYDLTLSAEHRPGGQRPTDLGHP